MMPQVLHVELSIEGSGMQYQPGDSIGVLPHNDPDLVQGVLQHLEQDGQQVFSVTSSSGDGAVLLQHLHWPCSLERALTAGCDLTSIPRYVICSNMCPLRLAPHAPSPGWKAFFINIIVITICLLLRKLLHGAEYACLGQDLHQPVSLGFGHPVAVWHTQWYGLGVSECGLHRCFSSTEQLLLQLTGVHFVYHLVKFVGHKVSACLAKLSPQI